MKTVRFAVLLLLIAALMIPSASAGIYGAGPYFTLAYDERAYQLDDLTYCDENVGGDHFWFFILYNDEFMFDVSMEASACGQSLSLADANAAARQDYVSCALGALRGENPALLNVLEAGKQKTPFYIFSLQNEDGPYLKAETVIRGRAFDFLAYYNDSAKPLDERLQNELTGLLNGFTPLF